MLAQRFAEENVLSSYEMTRYLRISHVLNNSFIITQITDFLVALTCRSRLRRLRRLHLRFLYVLTTVAFAMNITHLRTSHRDHVFCRSMKEEKAMSWSLRSEAERERRIMWRACIEFNIWFNIWINILILSHRMLESKLVLTHSEDQIFYICLRRFSCICFSLRYSRVIM